ncbi:ShlB/FhaC/HecB family hemolysin secretion/activation protein [Suttonella ornithocola]|uniref:Hemolysin transporter protein shlB n=1 Tax=Suttonella ornithocola TaxID=279832 RepID=A0A380MRF0_9GAMM|nr:ShlB/FhaC/HecB family hemolysin secretion/activation protein [Suttonella ornithocola]SUO95145.1 Hemolysin transporter protein shlB precursor [Suttonella ornithocola]
MLRYITIGVFSLSSLLVHAQISPEFFLDQAQKHQKTINQSQEKINFNLIKIPLSEEKSTSEISGQTPIICHQISEISIENNTQPNLNKYLFNSLHQLNYQGSVQSQGKIFTFFQPFPCLSVKDIELISRKTQNALIDGGWITARLLLPEQDLSNDKLTFLLLPGTLNKIVIDDQSSNHAYRLKTSTALPIKEETVINLRDIEQGLDNLRRLPTVQAQIDIAPSEEVGGSNLIIHWSQKKYPLRASLSLDNAGTKETGKYLVSGLFSYDNPLRLNDIFSFSYTRNILPGKQITDLNGHRDGGETNNYTLNYSIPYGYWALSLAYSQYYYDQIVAGQNQNYHYSGKSRQWQSDLSRVIYRDNQHKISLSAGLWAKRNFNFVDDTEVPVQRRQLGGWQISINQLSYFSYGVLNSQINYKQGKRWFGAIPAPEEAFDEGTAKMGILSADVHWNMPFHFQGKSFDWDSRWHGQMNTTKLTPLDRLSIGGRYSVRGYESGIALAAEKGFYTQNTLNYHYKPTHHLYLGLDAGYVGGRSAKQLPGQYLLGGAVGVKGSHQWHGNWDYDAYIGKALAYPSGFKPDTFTLGFSFIVQSAKKQNTIYRQKH